MLSNKINSYYLCFLSIILLSFLLLFFVALINYKIDPEKVYSNFFNINNSKETYSTEFINKLTKSEYGVSFEENILNERDIKYKLANYPTTAECAVIGSSPVFQISSFRKIKSFNSSTVQRKVELSLGDWKLPILDP